MQIYILCSRLHNLSTLLWDKTVDFILLCAHSFTQYPQICHQRSCALHTP